LIIGYQMIWGIVLGAAGGLQVLSDLGNNHSQIETNQR
jgi:hypothetical protein